MARDPRSGSAFTSGMRGREKPKVQGAHGGTYGQEKEGSAGGESKQGPDKQVGNPDGVNLNDSAYSSGMRGMEKSKQKSASGGATWGQDKEGNPGTGSNRQDPDTRVGNPDGEQSWSSADRGPKKGVADSHLQSTAVASHKLGIPGNNTEAASQKVAPIGAEGILGEEDDTHINIRIPKASLKKKNSGLQTS